MTDGRSPHRTLAPDTVGPPARQPTALRGRAAKANADKRHRVRALDGGLNVARLLDCWDDLNKDAASGGDGVTWPMDAANLQTQGEAWVARLKRQRDRAKLLRRHAMPQGNGQERPFGLPVIADQLLQAACARILNAIDAQALLGCRDGDRPGGGAGEAVRDLPCDWQYGR